MAEIRHVVVLMLENRSFDCVLGALYPKSDAFDGLSGEESNTWQPPDGLPVTIPVWNDPTLTAQELCIPDPDPGELFADVDMQIHGDPRGPATMGGFVANYMKQTPSPPDPRAVMHYFTPEQVPVISALARAFGVSDRWHSSAPTQTWPNRFFAHTGTAGGRVNNEPRHLFTMPTVFHALAAAGRSWHVYFHDVPQCAALIRLWPHALTHFSRFAGFLHDAALGKLPAYSFIEPRYLADEYLQVLPNDEHPPHNIASGEELIAQVYNAVRRGPGWPATLLLVIHDEHGGCYDHVVPPRATPPGGPTPDGYAFDGFGVRVPAVIVSPRLPPGSVLRPEGATPFDHTSIIATLRDLFGIRSLTARDAAAPSLAPFLAEDVVNDGPDRIDAPTPPPTTEQIARYAARPHSDLQASLRHSMVRVPTLAARLGSHARRHCRRGWHG